jgi:hypothetical protein
MLKSLASTLTVLLLSTVGQFAAVHDLGLTLLAL